MATRGSQKLCKENNGDSRYITLAEVKLKALRDTRNEKIDLDSSISFSSVSVYLLIIGNQVEDEEAKKENEES